MTRGFLYTTFEVMIFTYMTGGNYRKNAVARSPKYKRGRFPGPLFTYYRFAR